MEQTLPVDKNIPIPESYKTRPDKFPFAQLQIGDSFFIENVSKRFSIYANLRHFNERNQKSNQIRVVQRREGNGVRIWRIE